MSIAYVRASCVQKEKHGRLPAANEEKIHAGSSPRLESTHTYISEEKESYASEHWKDAHLPCSHPYSCGAFSSRLERFAPLQPAMVSPCTLSRRCLFGDDDYPLIGRTLVALATLARAGRIS